MRGIFICAADLLKRNFKQNIVLILQIAVTIIIFLGFTGTVRYIQSSQKVANTFSNSNALYYYPFSFTDNSLTGEKIMQESGLQSHPVGEADYLLVNCNDQMLTVAGYNDTLIEYADLELSSGKWFDEVTDTAAIPLIATTKNYSVNDRIVMMDRNGESHDAIVIGTISDDGYMLSFNKSASPSIVSIDFFASKPYSDFIAPLNSETHASLSEGYDMFLEMEIPKMSLGKVIFYEREEDIPSITAAFEQYGTIVNVDQMVSNYKEDNQFHLLINGIVLAVFAMLTATGIGGINGLQSRLDRRNYIIYYMLGMNRIQCALTELLRSCSVAAFGFLLSVVIYSLPFVKEMIFSSEMIIDIRNFLAAFVFLLLICCVVSLKYVLDLGKGSLMERYKNQN